MIVWIVFKNGIVDEVFDTEQAAVHHMNSLVRKWSLSSIVKKFVKSW